MDMQLIVVTVFIAGVVLGSIVSCLGMALVQINFNREESSCDGN